MTDIGQELELAAPAGGLFRSDDPDEIINQATRTADALAKVIHEQRLAIQISGRNHVRVEGWTLLGTFFGIQPYTVWSRPLVDPQVPDAPHVGWEARVEARTVDGRVISAAEAECRYDERNWKGRDSYALRSMAQTRATSKAMRLPLGFVLALAGFDTTPAEEMPPPYEQKAKVVIGPEVDPFDTTDLEPKPDFGPVEDPGLEQAESSMFKAPAQPRDRSDTMPLTKPQRGKIYALLGKLEKTGKPVYEKDSIRHQIGIEYGTETIEELYRWQAGELIDRLIKRCQAEGIEP
jgi:hypothetical protein